MLSMWLVYADLRQGHVGITLGESYNVVAA